MSKCGQLALEEASSTPAKGIFEWSLVACEPFDGESCQAGGRSIGWASHPSFSGKSFEETSRLGSIGSAAYDEAVSRETNEKQSDLWPEMSSP